MASASCSGEAPPAMEGKLLEGQLKLKDGAAYTAGAFTLRVQGLNSRDFSFSISHKTRPERKLWRSPAGKSFVMSAAGKEVIHESRGSFQVNDTIELRCKDQLIDRIGNLPVKPASIIIEGRLQCEGKPTRVDYRLAFTAVSENQLSFNISVKNEMYNRIYLVWESDQSERFFGFGEQFSYFDLKGRRLPIFVMEQGIGRGDQPITAGANLTAGAGGDWHTTYAGVPHFITSHLRSLFLENYEYSSFDMREDDRTVIEVFSKNMRGRILNGDSPPALIEEYTRYSGRMRALPDWILKGAVIGMQGGTEKVRAKLKALEAAGVPVAAFWLQDWEGQRRTSFGKQLWWNWELDRDRYPGWEKLVADLKARGIRVLTYINPFLADVKEKKNHRRNLFEEARKKGYLVKTARGEPYMILNTSFSAGLIDLTNPDARKWIKTVIKTELIAAGASGWMADFAEALPYDSFLHSGERPDTYHNRYPEEWAQVNREAIREAGREKDIVFFSRSGYTRSPGKTTLFWLGDQMVSWGRHDGIKSVVVGLLSGGISGYSLNHSDIGGYTTITHFISNYHRGMELMLRWIELSAFNGIFRTHEGNRPEQNHQFDTHPLTLKFFARFAKIYRAWFEYRKELVAEATNKGLPIVRHPFLHYPNDPRSLKDQS